MILFFTFSIPFSLRHEQAISPVDMQKTSMEAVKETMPKETVSWYIIALNNDRDLEETRNKTLTTADGILRIGGDELVLLPSMLYLKWENSDLSLVSPNKFKCKEVITQLIRKSVYETITVAHSMT